MMSSGPYSSGGGVQPCSVDCHRFLGITEREPPAEPERGVGDRLRVVATLGVHELIAQEFEEAGLVATTLEVISE